MLGPLLGLELGFLLEKVLVECLEMVQDYQLVREL